MKLLKKIFGSKAEPIVIVGSMNSSVQANRHDTGQIVYFSSMGLLILLIIFSWFSTGALISLRQHKTRTLFEAQEKVKLEEKNKTALATLSADMNLITQNQNLVAQAIPSSARQDQVVRNIAFLMHDLEKKYSVILPDHIAWVKVSPSDITNPDFKDFDTVEYSVPFTGEYPAFLEFLDRLRHNARLFDVRALRSFSPKEGNLVSADVIFWAYNLPPREP